jgi:tetraacyldisaccharide 4'-kinase
MLIKRILLFPFSFIYGGITAVRNFFYSKGIKKSYSIPGKSIVIGNLSMGGTGKSPHTLYLWNFLKQNHEVAILSRGYGRQTKGLIEVEQNHASNEVGDEPLMFKKRVQNNTQVIVSESRKNGVDFIRSISQNSVILLDDAFQHRKVKAGFSILLTDYSNPFYSDFVVPVGTLREWKCGKNRADCIIVTKCPESLSESEKQFISRRLIVYPFGGFVPNLLREEERGGLKHVFFSQIIYGDLISFGKAISERMNILLVTGIANPKPLENYLKRFYNVETMIFSDHHQFTDADLSKIHAKFDTFTPRNSIIVTTEKDFVRLETILTDSDKQKYPWYYQSITVKLDREEDFKTLINNYVDTI